MGTSAPELAQLGLKPTARAQSRPSLGALIAAVEEAAAALLEFSVERQGCATGSVRSDTGPASLAGGTGGTSRARRWDPLGVPGPQLLGARVAAIRGDSLFILSPVSGRLLRPIAHRSLRAAGLGPRRDLDRGASWPPSTTGTDPANGSRTARATRTRATTSGITTAISWRCSHAAPRRARRGPGD